MTSDRVDVALALDFETSGLGSDATVLEFGATIVTRHPTEDGRLSEWTPRGEMTALIDVDVDAVRASIDHFVDDMHTTSGLWDAFADPSVTRVPLAVAERELVAWVTRFAGPDTRVPLLGSGVSHFDRHVIAAQMPDLDARLTYWSYDVGTSRRIIQAAGVDYPDSPKAHRAMADTRQAVGEFMWQMAELPKIALVPPTDVRI